MYCFLSLPSLLERQCGTRIELVKRVTIHRSDVFVTIIINQRTQSDAHKGFQVTCYAREALLTHQRHIHNARISAENLNPLEKCFIPFPFNDPQKQNGFTTIAEPLQAPYSDRRHFQILSIGHQHIMVLRPDE
ncbi:rh49 [macacine betaherpesvirus 3]|uniref:Rh49 n=1 Tax=Rhesus cytomegalovirus (strain 68-1) TaxID=47929 RepID=Q2FAS1_RHCM6|nr:rh49 [macacine betaherpesvirus 3]